MATAEIYDDYDMPEELGTKIPELNPTVVHPTAASLPPARRRGAPPYLFLVSNVPRPFQEYLVKEAIFAVESGLKTLFFEAANPVPHDYVTTLKNYSMSTDTTEEQAAAIEIVRRSVVDRLFDHESNIATHLKSFLFTTRDNLPGSYSEERVRMYVRNSVRVELLHVVAPNTKILTPVYNVFIFPPTRDPKKLLQWRKWLWKMSFYTAEHGVGERYEYPFSCIHCKSIDHPGGLCPYTEGAGNGDGGLDDLDSDDELRPKKKGRAPRKPVLNPLGNKPAKGKGKASGTDRPGPSGPAVVVQIVSSNLINLVPDCVIWTGKLTRVVFTWFGDNIWHAALKIQLPNKARGFHPHQGHPPCSLTGPPDPSPTIKGYHSLIYIHFWLLCRSLRCLSQREKCSNRVKHGLRK